MRYIHFALLACAAAALATPPSASAPASSSPQSQASFFGGDANLQKVADGIVAFERMKGVAVGFLEPNGRRRIFIAGDAGAGGRPLGRETVFEIGSVTKTFTGALLADAVLRGEVKLEDPVAKYLSANVKMPVRGNRQITLLDLATHRSGLPRIATGFDAPDPTNPYATFDDARLLAWLSGYELERPPGEKPEYSNVGTGLLGYALARAAGVKDFPQLVRQRILRPLGMRSTDFDRSRVPSEWLAKGHDDKGAVVPYWDVASLSGAGGLNSTIGDMLTYLEANIGRPKNRIERAMRMAHQPRAGFTDGKIGLAWQIREKNGRTLLLHNGGTGGFSSVMAFDPKTGAGVVILANSASFWRREDIAVRLLNGNVAGFPGFDPATESSGR
jgi:D-alanyl-D-alanine-carboxypeptidase/D-alanyl-D-alanine-endopeptidase